MWPDPGSALGPSVVDASAVFSSLIFGNFMLVPSHCWPHQQRPSALMMQVPLPQQRSSSILLPFLISVHHGEEH